jgi:rhamnosyltransferase
MTTEALIVMRCFNDEWVVGDTLEAIHSQTGPGFRVVAIDSGSTDRSVDIIRSFPVQLIEIPPGTYIPGRVLNLGMEQGDEPFGVFINSDCTPQHPEWLESLLEPLRREAQVAAVYGRQVARPDATPLVVKDYERAFGDGSIAATWPHFFSMASSAIRRSVWQEKPFDPAIQYSEDVYWTWQRRREGWKIAYAEQSVAMHSHNYTLAETRRRFAGEGRADAVIYPREMLPTGWFRGVLASWAAEVARDWAWCLKRRQVVAATTAPAQRWAQRSSYWQGLNETFRDAPEP